MKAIPWLAAVVAIPVVALAAAPQTRTAPKPGPGDEAIRQWLAGEVEAISKNSLSQDTSIDAWNAHRELYRRQLAEMLGLWPTPEKTELKVTVTGKIDHPQFTVENLHFQSRPGLYVTANLYVPKDLKKPAPAILYVCGHGNVKVGGVSYGAKVSYQHWPAWFARNGYICLIIDTLQLAEIEGLHHGTYRMNMWWWYDRGYTPAGVEAWNAIRALDYLCTRPEVDREKLGVTGRSGGGAYSWWLAALDERVKAAVPTAGITDLRNHVVDGTVEGHCDCMFMVNTYRWDYAQVAALVAPRALLLENSDKDTIFPLDGVYRIHNQVRAIYGLTKSAGRNFGLLITEGPHKDTQDLQVPAFRWFRKHLNGDESTVDNVAVKLFEPQQLKVFKELPADQVNTKIQETFVPMAPPPAVPESKAAWERMREDWLAKLKSQSFGAWPEKIEAARLIGGASKDHRGEWALEVFECGSNDSLRPLLYLAAPRKQPAKPRRLIVNVLDEAGAGALLEEFKSMEAGVPAGGLLAGVRQGWDNEQAMTVFVAPRGVGQLAMTLDEKKRVHLLRRFYLVGTTLEAMQAWDVRRALQAIRSTETIKDLPVTIRASGPMAGVALYASLFEPAVERLELRDLPQSHASGPHFLNVLKFMDIPAAVAMAAERSKVVLEQKDAGGWEFPREVARKLGWEGRIEIRRGAPE